MQFSTLLSSIVMLSATGWAQYVLEDDYFAGNDFFGQFSFWDTGDPTHGFVQYQAHDPAAAQNLISGGATNAYMGVDFTNNQPNGRPSVRLTSNKSYNNGLVVVDIEHMPGGICGTWPAFWMVGPNWPNDGEIDIIEGVNDQTTNDMTLHTGPGCSISNNGGFTGTFGSGTCQSSGSNNNGCQIAATNSNTYGTGFNANGGGVYATEITESDISIWFFPRGSIPADITGGSPNPEGWGTPLSKFYGDCNVQSSFQDLQIVFDTTFCGDWAGNSWSSSSTCTAKASTCTDYVANHPGDFKDAYWSVNALKVYKSGWSNSPAVSAKSSSPAASTTRPASTTSSSAYVAPTTSTSQWIAPTTSASPSVAPTSSATSAPQGVPPTGNPIGQNSNGVPYIPTTFAVATKGHDETTTAAPTTTSAPAATTTDNSAAPWVGANGIINERDAEEAAQEKRELHLRHHQRHAHMF